MAENEREYGMVISFWIDTSAYSQRDKDMFVCGVEFQMLYEELKSGKPVVRTIHTENESRARMMAAKLGRKVQLTNSGYEGWTFLETTDDEESEDA